MIPIGEGPLELRLPAGRSVVLLRRPPVSSRDASPLASRVDAAVSRLLRRAPTPRVSELAEELGLSERHLGRAFRSVLGVPPKRFLRLIRFETVLALAHVRDAIDWADLAAECGYFDQAHLIRDFREFAGLTPARWHAGRAVEACLIEKVPIRSTATSVPTPCFAVA